MIIFLDIIPPTVTAQEHKIRIFRGKPMFYDTARLKEARKLLEDSLRPFVPEAPLEGEVCLATGWFFPTKTHREKSYRVTRPDTDNLQKLLKDCMTRVGFWKDDAQVCHEMIVKKWTRLHPGILIAYGPPGSEVLECFQNTEP